MDTEKAKDLAKQLRQPQGEAGKEVAEMMNKSNLLMNIDAIEAMSLKDNDIVVEIGMGNGFFVKDILSKADNVHYIGYDFSQDMVNESILLNQDFVNKQQAEFHKNNVNKLPLSDNSIDTLFTVNTIYFWDNAKEVLAEIKRVLKVGGTFIIGMRPKSSMETFPVTKYNFTMFSKDDMNTLLSDNGFKGVTILENDEPERDIFGEKLALSNMVLIAVN